jgi:hypothetical protein
MSRPIMMVENLNEGIRECLRYAEEHARQAKEASRPNLREDFLEMGRRWLRLANGYRFAQQRKRFGKTPLIARSPNKPRE